MYSDEQATHEMILEQVHDSGAEEWYCPTCGRRFLMQWPPNYKKVILDHGDVNAEHSGGKGGLRMGTPQVSQAEDSSDRNDAYLSPWTDWMNSVDFESYWD